MSIFGLKATGAVLRGVGLFGAGLFGAGLFAAGLFGRVGVEVLVGLLGAGCGAEILCGLLVGRDGLARTLVNGVASAPMTIPIAVAK